MDQQETTRTIFSFFGPPGSGKGTLAQSLVQRYAFRVFSTGNLCRELSFCRTEQGCLIEQFIRKGKLIPDKLIVSLVEDWLKTQQSNKNPIILDGFPRTQGQAQYFYEFLGSFWGLQQNIFTVICFGLDVEEIVYRLAKRLICGNPRCQMSFTASENLTDCKFCGNVLIRREDDQEVIVKERLASYPFHRDILLEFYKKVHQNVEIFDVGGLSPEGVYERFCFSFGLMGYEKNCAQKQGCY